MLLGLIYRITGADQMRGSIAFVERKKSIENLASLVKFLITRGDQKVLQFSIQMAQTKQLHYFSM